MAAWPWIAGADLGQRLVDLVGPLLTQILVRPLMVVVPTELVTQSLQFLDRLGRAVVGVEFLQGAVIALQLAARLRVRGPTFELPDFQRGEPLLEVHRLVAVARNELDSIVTDGLSRCAVLSDR